MRESDAGQFAWILWGDRVAIALATRSPAGADIIASMTTQSPDGPAAPTYLEHARRDWGGLAIWDYLRYDDEGELWINDLRVSDAAARYGTPLEIVDTTIVERRATEWVALSRAVAAEVGYPGRLRYLYAAKANLASEITHAAYRSGWGAETSALQDLEHLEWMADHGLVRRDIRVVCNGFKLPAGCYGWPSDTRHAGRALGAGSTPGSGATGPTSGAGAADRIRLPELRDHMPARGMTYADRIVALARAGWDITPVLDEGELDTFLDPSVPPMKVGVRLKFGPVATRAELDGLVSRFGMLPPAVAATAGRIAASGHLTFTTLHAMAGSAEGIPIDAYVAAFALAGRIWAELRRDHPTLSELNTGGGMPPLGDAYDHRAFLRGFFRSLASASAAAEVPPPDVTFELGNLIAAESGFHVFKVLQHRRNHAPVPDGVDDWALVDGGLMAAIPDMLLIHKPFRCLSARHAHAPASRVRLGDLTCDSDGRYPPKAFTDAPGIWLPDAPGDNFVVIQGVGAYQEILAGVRGAHHCGLLEAIELILERGADGVVRGRLMPRQTAADAARLLGYTAVAADALARTRPSDHDR